MKNVTATLRLYGKRRKIGTWLVIGSFLLFLAVSLLVQDFQDPFGWAIWASFALFAVSCVAFLTLTRCPFCGKTIVIGSMNRKNCPHCKRMLVEKSPDGKKAKELEKRSGQ